MHRAPAKSLLHKLRLFCVFLVAATCAGCESNSDISFNRDIRPILNERCVSCHGGIKRQADLNLLWREDATRPAESGKAAIVPHKPAESELIRRVSLGAPQDRMPQDDHPLDADEIRKLRRWIASGAPWDVHWAYRAPVSPELPRISLVAWPRSGLDHFVLHRLESEDLSPSPEAECPQLVRRVTLDLIGLAPTLEDTRDACGPEGYEAYVDRLLASPRFGERWAAMWLDLARYADSKGYEKDIPRTIWRYRDWVIRAFNDDMPFDQFTIEQLAGDLLPDATVEQRIATAFHRNTMTNTEGGTDDEEFRVAAVIDRVNTTWEVWQGTSMSCVQCHGHPYDPFRHEDYYRLFAFFNNTADRDQDDEYPTVPQFAAGDSARGHALLQELESLEHEILAVTASESVARQRREWEGRLDEPAVIGRVRGMLQNEVRRIVQTPEEDRDGAQKALLDRVYGGIHDLPRLDSLRHERSESNRQLADLEAMYTPVMKELPPEMRRTTRLFERGSFLAKRQVVKPGIPSALPPLSADAPRTRLGLAEWLVSADNPLTARVTVNRFWEQLFGTGIVESLEDFGTQGAAPSHPLLLDYLAVRFQETHDWSVKSLLREIVTSATYRQDSRATSEILERDPLNRLLARGPRFRLSAEQIRDQALFVSGLLSDKMFGPGVKPPQPEGLWQNPYDASKWETSYDEDRYRRGIYTYWRRTVPYPSMVTFGSPSREFCVSRRIRTNTPLQALVTLNDPAFVEAAKALAIRMRATGATASDRLSAGYRMAMAESPSGETLRSLAGLYEDAMAHYLSSPNEAVRLGGDNPELAALTLAANAILNLDQFVTKQ